jgi:hypothetical protein
MKLTSKTSCSPLSANLAQGRGLRFERGRSFPITQNQCKVSGSAFCGIDISLHFAKRDWTIRQPSIGVKHRIVGIFPSFAAPDRLWTGVNTLRTRRRRGRRICRSNATRAPDSATTAQSARGLPCGCSRHGRASRTMGLRLRSRSNSEKAPLPKPTFRLCASRAESCRAPLPKPDPVAWLDALPGTPKPRAR